MPKLSIIVPVYKAEKYLHRCIDSVLAQTYKDWELLLVDDGSPDKSGAICDECARKLRAESIALKEGAEDFDNAQDKSLELKDDQIRVFHKENGGVSSARNLGLDNAKGEWICSIDADDCIDEDFFVDLSGETSQLVLQNWTNSDDAKQGVETYQTGIYKGEELNSFMSSYMNRYIMRTPWGKFFRRDIIEKNHIRFDERFRVGEDTLFVLQYLKFCTSVHVLSTSRYIYTPPETAHSTKYDLPMKTALTYQEEFERAYITQPYKCPNLILFIWSFIFECLNRTDILFRLWWYLQPVNIRLRKLTK